MSRRVACLVLLLALGCSKPVAAPADASATATPIASAAPSASAASAPPGDLADGYTGTIDPSLMIHARLHRKGDRVTGAYFYETAAAELELDGTVGEDGAIALEERDKKKVTGSFAGRLDATGAIAGEWTSAKNGEKRPFQWSPVPRRAGAPAIVATRKYHLKTKLKDPRPGFDDPTCIIDATYPDLFGLPDAAVEAAINKKVKLEALGGPGDCDFVGDYTVRFSLGLNRDGILSFTLDNDNNCMSCAHPSMGGKAYNLLLATGEDVPLKKVMTKGATAKLEKLLDFPVRRHIQDTSGASQDDYDMLMQAYLAGDYLLEENGIRMIASYSLPHAVQALDGEGGELLTYEWLKGALDPRSPVAAAWKGR